MKFTKTVSKLAITLLISMYITSFGMNNMNKKSKPAFIKIKDEKINFTIEDISPDCKYAVSVPTDQKLVIYNLDDLSVVREYKQTHQLDDLDNPDDIIYGVKFSPCGNYVITEWANTITLCEVHKQKQKILYRHNSKIEHTDYNNNSTRIALVDNNGFVIVYDTNKQEIVCQYNHYDNNVIQLCISPDGNFVASRSSNCAFILYDIEKKEKIKRECGYIGFIQNSRYAFFATHRFFGSTTMTIYDTTTRENPLNLGIPKQTKIISACLSNDNRYLAVGNNRGLVKTYDINNQKKPEEIDKFHMGNNSRAIRKLRFCFDNRYLYAITNTTFIIRNIEKRKNIFKYFNNAKIKAIRLSSEYDKLVLFDGRMNLTAFKTKPSHNFYKHNKPDSAFEKEDKAERIRFSREEDNLYRENNQRKDCIKLYIGSEKFNVSKIFLLM